MFLVSDHIYFLYENNMPADYDGKLTLSFRYILRFRNEPWSSGGFFSMLDTVREMAFI